MDNVVATLNIGRLVTLILGLVDKVAATLYLGRLDPLSLVPCVTSLFGRRTTDLECIISGLSRDREITLNWAFVIFYFLFNLYLTRQIA